MFAFHSEWDGKATGLILSQGVNGSDFYFERALWLLCREQVVERQGGTERRQSGGQCNSPGK